MKTLAQFKQELGVTSIEFMQGKGRTFATIGTTDIIVSKECDRTKPLFVIPLTNKDNVRVDNAYVVCNASADFAFTL